MYFFRTAGVWALDLPGACPGVENGQIQGFRWTVPRWIACIVK